jgi:hypothetical protein
MTASEAVLQAKSAWERRQATGFDQVALMLLRVKG